MRLERVGVDDVRVGRLLQLYLHEWSALVDKIAIGADALYVYPELMHVEAALFLDDAGVPFGFAFTKADDDARVHVEEFFVIASARRRGLGTAAARALFRSKPGPWTFTVRPENPGALTFWRRACPGEALETVEVGDDGIARTRLSFSQA